ncbi:MAG: hypothetical protein N3E52_02975 [Candidatus Bathyarchaeota archaeon]|nr:hypothetical protein [Candidatus Bathyarchaeota archaeon]
MSWNKDAILPRMRRRNAVRDSHQALHLQKLWPLGNPARTVGNEREVAGESGVDRGRKTTRTERIFEMVVKQEKVAA